MATSHGPWPHSDKPATQANDVCVMAALLMVLPNPFDPPRTCLPKDSTTTPRGISRAVLQAASRTTGHAASSGVASTPRT